MKTYLGDGVYAEFDGHQIVLTAEDGIQATDRIVLEPEVLGALVAFAERIKSADRNHDGVIDDTEMDIIRMGSDFS